MPDYYDRALILARLIKEATNRTILYIDIAQLIKDTDGVRCIETDEGFDLIFRINKQETDERQSYQSF